MTGVAPEILVGYIETGGKPVHGYKVKKILDHRYQEVTGGNQEVFAPVATFYRGIDTLIDSGMLEAVSSPDDTGEDDPRRQYHQITNKGKEQYEKNRKWAATLYNLDVPVGAQDQQPLSEPDATGTIDWDGDSLFQPY